MKNIKNQYASLYSIKDLSSYNNQDALNHIALLIDTSFDTEEVNGLNLAVELIIQVKKKELQSTQIAELFYFLANINHYLRILNDYKTDNSFILKCDEIEKEIFYLRSAINEPGFNQLYITRKCQILTNLGNFLSEIGRFVEAVEFWEKSLEILPEFDMARANLGYGLFYYGKLLYDDGHRNLFIKFAYKELCHSLQSNKFIHDGAKSRFSKCINLIETLYDQNYLLQEFDMTNYSLGKSKKEINYRNWCLKNKLFLNPLNDLGPYNIASYDIFSIPPIVIKIDEAPSVPGLFNLIKQEFASARYLYYEGINSRAVHFSDKGVVLHNTLDYSSFSLALEKVKVAFRMAYSLFDKIAFLINYYFDLGISEDKVNFRTLWYVKKNNIYDVREDIKNKENWPLRGLYWLSKDIFEKDIDIISVIEPDAKEINTIRNHIEHKYLKIHEFEYSESTAKDMFYDNLSYHISRLSFENKTLKLIKLVRAAIIYLSLSIHVEEFIKSQTREPDSIIMPISGGEIKDSWKR